MRPEIKAGLIVGFVAIVGGAFLWLSNDSEELDSLPLDKQTVDASASNDVKHTSDARADRSRSSSREDFNRSSDRGGRSQQPEKPPVIKQRSTPRPSQRITSPKADREQKPNDPGRLGSRFPQRGTAPPAAKPAELAPDGEEKQPATVKNDEPKNRAANPASEKQTVEKITPEAPAVTQPTPKPELRPTATKPPLVRESLTQRTTPTPRQKKIKIQPGDFLITIAENEYGDGALWRAIKEANPGLDENRLKVGQEIVIPDKEEARKLLTAGTKKQSNEKKPEVKSEAVKAGRSTYVVEHGDTLSKIAKNVLGDAKRWREIYDLNRAKLDSPDIVPVGVELTLPPVKKTGD